MKGFAIQFGFQGALADCLQTAFEVCKSPVLKVGGVPHLSLAVFQEDHRNSYVSVARDFAGSLKLRTITVDGVSSFPGEAQVAYLSIAPDPALLEAHQLLHTQLDAEGVSSIPLYRPENWVPHITLTMEDEVLKERCLQETPTMDLFGELELGSVRVVEFRPVRVIEKFKLPKIS